jgi:hypothetical protein
LPDRLDAENRWDQTLGALPVVSSPKATARNGEFYERLKSARSSVCAWHHQQGAEIFALPAVVRVVAISG